MIRAGERVYAVGSTTAASPTATWRARGCAIASAASRGGPRPGGRLVDPPDDVGVLEALLARAGESALPRRWRWRAAGGCRAWRRQRGAGRGDAGSARALARLVREADPVTAGGTGRGALRAACAPRREALSATSEDLRGDDDAAVPAFAGVCGVAALAALGRLHSPRSTWGGRPRSRRRPGQRWRSRRASAGVPAMTTATAGRPPPRLSGVPPLSPPGPPAPPSCRAWPCRLPPAVPRPLHPSSFSEPDSATSGKSPPCRRRDPPCSAAAAPRAARLRGVPSCALARSPPPPPLLPGAFLPRAVTAGDAGVVNVPTPTLRAGLPLAPSTPGNAMPCR